MTHRLRPSPKTKLMIFLRQNGYCACGCGRRLDGTQEFDHVLALALGGSNDVENLAALLPVCHRRKTGGHDIPRIRKADRQGKAANPRKPEDRKPGKIRSRGFPKGNTRRALWKCLEDERAALREQARPSVHSL